MVITSDLELDKLEWLEPSSRTAVGHARPVLSSSTFVPCKPVLRSVESIGTVSRFVNDLSSNIPLNVIEIAHFNANSLLGHIDLIKAHLDSHFYDIIAVSET